MQASSFVTLGMLVIPFAVALGFVWLCGQAGERAGLSPRAATLRSALGMTAWMAACAGLAASGLLSDFELRPPPFMALMAAVFATVLALALGRLGTRFVQHLPLAWLVMTQAFRLPLELVMHQAAREGVMPNEMSYSGYNFDIVSGATALMVGLLLLKGRAPRWLVLLWNVLGTLLLANIVTIAVLATPLIRAFGSDPRHLNTWVTHVPFVWLPTVLVAFALFGHVLIFRALARVTNVAG